MKTSAFSVIHEPFACYKNLLARMMPSIWFVAKIEGEPVGLVGGHKQGLIGIALGENASVEVADDLVDRLEEAQIGMGTRTSNIIIDASRTREISLLSRCGYTIHGFVRESRGEEDQISMLKDLQKPFTHKPAVNKQDMAQVFLSVLEEDDIQAAANIAAQLFQEELPHWTKETWIGALSKSSIRFVAKMDAELVGFLAGREGWIDAIAVIKEMQGKGVGGLLMDKIEEHHIERNLSRIRLHVKGDNTKAISFYSRKGYQVHGIVLTHSGNSVLMHKKLR